MDWRLGVLVGLLAVVVVAFILTPPEDPLVVVPGDVAGEGRIAPVDIPLAPLATPGAVVPEEAPSEDAAVLKACRPVHERITALADEALGGKVGDAARAKYDTAGMIAWCEAVIGLTDDELKARVAGDLQVAWAVAQPVTP